MRTPLVIAVLACALSAFDAAASMPTGGPTLIVQQRTADGRILFTDRPLPGATTERSWTVHGAPPAIPADRSDSVEAFYGVPRHIDARWRPIAEDPERDRVVRMTLERERLLRRPGHR